MRILFRKTTKLDADLSLKRLVITIIVMLILAGVSLNAIIGDNGIINNAQKATMLNSCAFLEEFIQEYYVGKLDELPQDVDSKVEALQNYNESKNWFYNPCDDGYGTVNYAVDSDDNALYLIKKSELPDEIKKQLRGGEAKNYYDFVMLKDVYGVTRDLKVYYCSNGKESMLAMSSEQLDKENPEREIFDSNKEETANIYTVLSKFDSDEDGILTLQEIKGITNLTVSASDNLTTLKGFENLKSLKNLVLDNVILESLDGISGAVVLETLQINNSVIGNYDDLGKNKNLTSFKFLSNQNIDSNVELKKICGMNEDGHIGISKGEFSKLEIFGFFGAWSDDGSTDYIYTYSNLTDITCIENLSKVTKASIKKLYLQNNPIISIDHLDGFNNVEILSLIRTNVIDLKGIRNLKGLKTLLLGFCSSLGINDVDSLECEENALYEVKNCINLEKINLSSCGRIRHLEYIKNFTKLNYLHINGCPNIEVQEMRNLKTLFSGIETFFPDPVYSFVLLGNDTISLDCSAQNITEENFRFIANCTNLKQLFCHGCRIIDESNQQLSLEDSNKLFNEVLKSLSNLEYLDLCSCLINSVDFIYDSGLKKVNTPKLKYLHSRDNNIVDYSNLEYCPIEGLSISNSDIDLTRIQETISRIDSTKPGWMHAGNGLVIRNKELFKKLKDCTLVTSIQIDMQNNWWDGADETVDLSGLTNLRTFEMDTLNINVKLPAGLENLTIANCSIFPDLSNCSSLKTIDYHMGSSWKSWPSNNAIESLLTFDDLGLERNALESVSISDFDDLLNLDDLGSTFSTSKLMINNCVNFSSTSGIDGMTDLTEVELTNNPNLKYLTDMSQLNLLTRLDLQNCMVDKLDEIENLNNIIYLNLTQNALLFKYTVDGREVRNLNVISKFKDKNSNFEVYLKGNSNITDWSALSKYTGWWHEDEKAGY